MVPNTLKNRLMFASTGAVLKDPLWHMFGFDYSKWRRNHKTSSLSNTNSYNSHFYGQNNNLYPTVNTERRYPDITTNYDDYVSTSIAENSAYEQRATNRANERMFQHHHSPAFNPSLTHLNNQAPQVLPNYYNHNDGSYSANHQSYGGLYDTIQNQNSNENTAKTPARNRTYGSLCLRYLKPELFKLNLSSLKAEIEAEYRFYTNLKNNTTVSSKEFNFKFDDEQEIKIRIKIEYPLLDSEQFQQFLADQKCLEVDAFLSQVIKHFTHMPERLKNMFRQNGEWHKYFVTYISYPRTQFLLNSLNEIFNSLSKSKSVSKNKIFFDGLLEIVDKNELKCVNGTTTRILSILNRTIYAQYKEEISNLIIQDDMGKLLITEEWEIHLLNYLDHVLLGIPLNLMFKKDDYSGKIDSEHLKSVANLYTANDLSKLLGERFYELVKGIFTYIFQELRKNKGNLPKTLENVHSLYYAELRMLLPKNQTLNDYILLEDGMPTNKIDEYKLIKDICDNNKIYINIEGKSQNLKDFYSKILRFQFAELASSQKEIDRIRKSKSTYLADFVRENLDKWICLKEEEKDLITNSFKQRDEKGQQLLALLLDTDNFFNLYPAEKFELFMNINNNQNSFIQELIKTYQY